MGIRFAGESAEYRAARDRLLEQEIELRRAMEAVAVARRRLPPGGMVPGDYAFQGRGMDGDSVDVRLSELFAPGKDSLVIYSMMFPRDPGDERPGPQRGQTALLPLAEGPCRSCTALLDQLEGAAEHLSQRVNLAVVGKAPLRRILAFADERGWRRLRLLSSARWLSPRNTSSCSTCAPARGRFATQDQIVIIPHCVVIRGKPGNISASRWLIRREQDRAARIRLSGVPQGNIGVSRPRVRSP